MFPYIRIIITSINVMGSLFSWEVMIAGFVLHGAPPSGIHNQQSSNVGA